MTSQDDFLELSILYDTARGFLGLRDRKDILSTALLSLMGACGASRAVYLERDRGDRLVPTSAEGDPPQDSLRLTRKFETAFTRSRSPVHGKDLGGLGVGAVRFAEQETLELFAPLADEKRLYGVVALGPKLLKEPYGPRDERMVQGIVEQARLALGSFVASANASRSGRDPLPRIRSLRKKHPGLASIRGHGEFTLSLLEKLVALAEFDLPVLILGETGTGKELVARAIHDLSRRRKQPFEAINCAAIPRDLMASALFGHEKGAFTGADSTVPGAFERSTDGTIFLDEIGDMPQETQAILLRVLQERGFRRVGGSALIPTNARVISATNRHLIQEVEDGNFRRDLYYRLQMYTVRIRPLRERKEEIPALAEHILRSFAGPTLPRISEEFLARLTARDLRGNVRELESLIAGAIVHSGGADLLEPRHLPEDPAVTGRSATESVPTPARVRPADGVTPPAEGDVPSYESMEREYIRNVLNLTEGNQREAARLMGIPRTTLIAKIKRFGIRSGRGREAGKQLEIKPQ